MQLVEAEQRRKPEWLATGAHHVMRGDHDLAAERIEVAVAHSSRQEPLGRFVEEFESMGPIMGKGQSVGKGQPQHVVGDQLRPLRDQKRGKGRLSGATTAQQADGASVEVEDRRMERLLAPQRECRAEDEVHQIRLERSLVGIAQPRADDGSTVRRDDGFENTIDLHIDAAIRQHDMPNPVV